MNWIVLSILSTLFFSTYTILQKYVFQRHLSNIFAFALWGSILHLAVATAILVAEPLPDLWSSGPVILVLGTGLLHAAYTLLIYKVIRREDEVSRVVPVVDTYPIFILVLAVIFLGEAITFFKVLAIGLIMSGAILASWHQALPGSRMKLGNSFALLLLASVGIAVYSVLAKYALGHLSIWHVYALTSIGAVPAYLLAVQRYRAWPEVRLVGRRVGALAATGAANTMLALAFITGFMAFTQGPVSLSSAIMGSRPLIVLAYATLISILLPKVLAEQTSREALVFKGLAAGLVTAGVGAMAFV